MTNPFDWTGGRGSDAMGEMWRSWMAMAAPPATVAPPTGTNGLADFLNPMTMALFGGTQVGDALKNMTEGPRLADAGEAEHRVARLMERWIEVQTASRAYEGVIAAAKFASKLQQRFSAGDATKPDDALKLWLETANTTLLETQRSPSFLEAQRQLLRCGMDFLLAQREVVENLVEPAGLPHPHGDRRGPSLDPRAQAPATEARAGAWPMIPLPTAGPAELLAEAAALNQKLNAGMRRLAAIKDDQVEIATTPKDEVFRTDKTTLYRYRPLAEQRVATPMLIVYSLIGRHTMTDLQEDRSLVRNLLGQGIDLWVVDWGNATRADRWLTIDDYVSGYLADCVSAMCEATGAEKINLLGICEGGVFNIAYAALNPERVKNLVLTVTPLDFHADVDDETPGRGFINVWTRSLTADDVDRMIDVWGVLPGEFMSAIFSMLTPIRHVTKYNSTSST